MERLYARQDKRLQNKAMVNCLIFIFLIGNFHLGGFQFFTIKKKNQGVSPLENNKPTKCRFIIHQLCEDQGRTNPKWQQSKICTSSPDTPLSPRSVCPFVCSSFPLWCVKGTSEVHQNEMSWFCPKLPHLHKWHKPKTKTLLTPFPPSLQIPYPPQSEVLQNVP